MRGVDPLAELPEGERWRAALAALGRAGLTVACAPRRDETAAALAYVCPEPHFLEAWGDAEALAGVVSLTQPTLPRLGATRELAASLAAWSGAPAAPRELVRGAWRDAVFPRAGAAAAELGFEAFFDGALEAGFVQVAPRHAAGAPGDAATAPTKLPAFDLAAVAAIPRAVRPSAGAFAVTLYPKVGLRDGRHAYNPWLQELPDPVSKVTWDNYAALSPAAAAALGVAEGDVVRLEAAGGPTPVALELPAYVQPGQHDQLVAVALGYGRAASERFADAGPSWLFARRRAGRVGINAAPLLVLAPGPDAAEAADAALRYAAREVTVRPTGRRVELAVTQHHHRLEVPAHLAAYAGERRPIVEETALAAYAADPAAGTVHAHGPSREQADLWAAARAAQPPAIGAHRRAMAIDLNACTGCAACVVACQAENNVPVVGYDEVRRGREMHWLRLDRYWSGPDDDLLGAHQPMLCQHCGNAPCETVCPVLATVHSAEGLNQQVYNRCVGTRYCANNCPYKVRRFNWFDYPHDERLANLALNPDVTVRARGVMEKCSFCVQRIQEAKAEAAEARSRGGAGALPAIATACQQSCPAQAIVFGDLADPASEVARRAADPRAYRVLEEVGVEPSISYLRLVRHRDAEAPAAPAAEGHHV